MCAKPTEGWGNLQEGGQSYHPLRRSLGSSLHLPMMQKWVEYVRRASGDSCIWNTGHQYGDWLALDAGDGSYTGASRKNFIATAFYAHSAQLLAQAMDALDMDGAAYHRLFAERRPNVHWRYILVLRRLLTALPRSLQSWFGATGID